MSTFVLLFSSAHEQSLPIYVYIQSNTVLVQYECCTCLQVAVLATNDAATIHSAFEVGRHYGMAFQLTDDLLDLTGTEAQLGNKYLILYSSIDCTGYS